MIHPLRPLPRLGAQEPYKDCDKHNTPLPANTLVQEHNVVQYRDIQRRENNKEDNRDGIE